VPILIGDPQTGAFAAVHAGWRGTSSSVVKTALEKMRSEFGSRAEDMIAAIGPAALGCCYEVGSDVIAMFRENFSHADELFTSTGDGRALIDLHRANLNQLTGNGVLPENIYLAPLCTMERADLFFSHRRESRAHGKTGRLMSVIGRR
jgi:purine-nucleoside/S-methyl-5'-thioadenosine phosphorylase / adenosine deaminase